MKLFFFLFLLFEAAMSLACNISEKELLLRMSWMRMESHLQSDSRSLLYDDIPQGNITRSDFRRLIEQVKRIYLPIFREQGMNFRIETSWDDDQVNAFAGVRGHERYVLLYGGYARHPLMTKDAFLSVICHEIGHHLGGYPKKSIGNWSSTEGQADYFSTLKCMKLVLKRDPQNGLAEELNVPMDVRKQCLAQFPKLDDYQICLRSAKAAEDHALVLADLSKKGEVVSLLTPARERVKSLNMKHPDSQCRLDTKLAGALCNVSPLQPLDDHDETIGTCHFNNFHILGTRPECWFVHKKG